jgi:hypothetical protein
LLDPVVDAEVHGGAIPPWTGSGTSVARRG